jgi:ribosomal protein L32E
MSEPVHWLKKKYTVGKTWGQKSSSNDSTRRRLKRKVSDAMKVAIKKRQPHMVRVVSPTGKARMVKNG